jgi:hypothetical protein
MNTVSRSHAERGNEGTRERFTSLWGRGDFRKLVEEMEKRERRR